MDLADLLPSGSSAHIDGAYAREAKGARFEVKDPARGTALATLISTPADTIDIAVESARKAQAGWAEWPPEERAAILRRAAQLLRARRARLAALEVRNTGRPIAEIGPIDVETAAQGFEFFAALALADEHRARDYPTGTLVMRREPLGVCAGIGAWNYPLQIAAWKAAPALAAGNAMVFKPSEKTPLSALLLAELLSEAGLPPGLFNVVLGAGDVGAALVSHHGVDHVAMTGSVATGQKILGAAAATVKITSLELGGKSPFLILEDADMEQAARLAVIGNFMSCGEICGNTTRVFVPRARESELLERVAEIATAIRTGDPLTEATQNGALIDLAHRDKVHGYVQSAVQEGAEAICGGIYAEVKELPHGAFYLPTVLARCRDNMRAVREEIFGPVMAVLSYEDEDEAVTRANATEFGLCAAVASRDHGRAQRVARRLEAGTVWVNAMLDLPVGMGYGGFKQSGIGYENGVETLRDHQRVKGIYTGLNTVELPFT
ncbi:MAG: betaine-aldehyde dehydrogenase [Roseovarius sp.]